MLARAESGYLVTVDSMVSIITPPTFSWTQDIVEMFNVSLWSHFQIKLILQ